MLGDVEMERSLFQLQGKHCPKSPSEQYLTSPWELCRHYTVNHAAILRVADVSQACATVAVVFTSLQISRA